MARRRGSAKPKPIKIDMRLDVGSLKTAFEYYPLDTLLGLQMAVDWYGATAPKLLHKSPLTVEEQRTLNKAQKLVTLGEGTVIVGEKTQAWSTALKLYEKLWAAKLKLPAVATAEKPSQNAKRVLELLGAMNTAYTALDVRFEPTLIDKERCVRGRAVVVPYQELLTMAAQPLLKVVLEETPNVASLLSIVIQEGQPTMDGTLFMQNLNVVLSGVYTWMAAGVTLRHVTRERRVRTAAPRTPRVGTGRYNQAAVIQLLSTKHPYRGRRKVVFETIRDGMTVADFVAALAATGLQMSANRALSRAIGHNLIQVQ